MLRLIQYILTLTLMLAMVVSATGVTVYYHHCSSKDVTYISPVNAHQCEHHRCHNIEHEELPDCCKEVNNETPTSVVVIDSTQCCQDYQVENILEYETVISKVQNNIEAKYIEIKTNINNKLNEALENSISYIKQKLPVLYYISTKIVRLILFFTDNSGKADTDYFSISLYAPNA